MTYLIDFRLFQVTSDIDLVTLKEPHVKPLFPIQLSQLQKKQRLPTNDP